MVNIRKLIAIVSVILVVIAVFFYFLSLQSQSIGNTGFQYNASSGLHKLMPVFFRNASKSANCGTPLPAFGCSNITLNKNGNLSFTFDENTTYPIWNMSFSCYLYPINRSVQSATKTIVNYYTGNAPVLPQNVIAIKYNQTLENNVALNVKNVPCFFINNYTQAHYLQPNTPLEGLFLVIYANNIPHNLKPGYVYDNFITNVQ